MKTKNSRVKLSFFFFSVFVSIAQVQASEKNVFLKDIPAFSSPMIWWRYSESTTAALQKTEEKVSADSADNEELPVEAQKIPEPIRQDSLGEQSLMEIPSEFNTESGVSWQYAEPFTINNNELTVEAQKMPEPPIRQDSLDKQSLMEEMLKMKQQQRDENAEANVSLLKTVTMLIANNQELITAITKSYEQIKQYNVEKQALLEEITALKQQNASYIEAESILQKQAEELIEKNNKLQLAINDKKTVKLDSLEDKYSYSLGVMLLKQIVDRVKRNDYGDTKISIAKVFDGVSGVYNNDIALSMDEINSHLADFDKELSEKIKRSESEIKKKLSHVKYITLPDGAYLVVDKKGKKPYNNGDTVVFELREAWLSDQVIINNLYNKVIFGDGDFPVFLAEAMNKGMQNGVVSIYAMASYFYNTESLPKDIKETTPVKFTISFK